MHAMLLCESPSQSQHPPAPIVVLLVVAPEPLDIAPPEPSPVPADDEWDGLSGISPSTSSHAANAHATATIASHARASFGQSRMLKIMRGSLILALSGAFSLPETAIGKKADAAHVRAVARSVMTTTCSDGRAGVGRF
jgi:hypothetical protein